jgi:glycosyltransferase involved in cell wall biosynthesis
MTQYDIEELKKKVANKSVIMLAWRDLDDVEAGGSERHAHEIAKRWSELGLNVTMRTSTAFGRPKEIKRDGYKVIRRAGRYLSFPRTISSVATGRSGRFDGLVEIWNGMPFFSPLWFSKPKLVILHHVHGIMWQMALPDPLAKAGNFIEEHFGPRFYKRVPIIAPSFSAKNEMVKLMGLKDSQIKVVPPGIDPVFKPVKKKANHPYLIAVGRLVPVKQFFEFVDLVVELRKTFGNLEAEIIGDGYERDYLSDYIMEKGAQTYCKLRGRVSQNDLISAYSRAWLLVSNSIKEGWNLTISEAAACGTPTVATDIPGHQDAVINGKTGLLCSSKNEQLHAIEMILKNDDIRATYSANALENAKRLSWDATAYLILNELKLH